MAKRRDFSSAIEDIKQRRIQLRNQAHIPDDVIAEAEILRSTTKEVKVTQDLQLPLQHTDPADDGTKEAGIIEPLSPERICSSDFQSEFHDDLSNIIAQLNVNRLHRGSDNSCLKTLSALLEAQHIFLTKAQISTLLPAHMEILLELITRAYTEGLDSHLVRSCRLMECIVTSPTDSVLREELITPLGSINAMNILLAISLETSFYNEAMNIAECSVKYSKNRKQLLLRMCSVGQSEQ